MQPPTLFVRNLLSANLLAFSVIWLTREYRRVCLFQSWSWSPSSRLSWPVSSPSTASSSQSSSPESSTQRPNTHFTSEISVLASWLVSSMGLYRKLLTSTLINPRHKLVRVRRYLVFCPLVNGAVFPGSEFVYDKGHPSSRAQQNWLTYLTRSMMGVFMDFVLDSTKWFQKSSNFFMQDQSPNFCVSRSLSAVGSLNSYRVLLKKM